jgi:glycosyltransferase involved in cell wall biosynthesis
LVRGSLEVSAPLSIVMATYNGEAFLEQQLDSLFAQTFHDFLLIVCDDGSTDNTTAIIKAYQERFDNITLYHNKRPLGVAKNFAKGVALAQSPYIALCDQDDLWQCEKLEKSIDAMRSLERQYPKAPLMVHSDLSVIDEANEEIFPSFFDLKGYTFNPNRHVAQMVGRCGVMGNTLVMNLEPHPLMQPVESHFENRL